MTAAQAVPATAPPTGSPPGLGAPDGADGDFAATLLDIATARTATAEGHEKGGDAAQLAALLLAVPAPAVPPAPALPAGPVAATPSVPAQAAPAPAVAEQAAPAAPAPPAAPPAAPVPAAPPTPAAAAAPPPASDAPALPAAAPADKPATAEPDHSVQAPPTAPAPARTPVAHPAHQPPAPRRLPIEPDHVRALLRIASHRGQAQAHLTLHPAELGGVEVKLRVTTQGLVATVTADRPDAAQVLQQAGADLRRAFEAQGVEVAALDIGFAGDHDGRRATERRAERTAPAAALDPTELSPTDDPSPNTTAIALGALVDVLA